MKGKKNNNRFKSTMLRVTLDVVTLQRLSMACIEDPQLEPLAQLVDEALAMNLDDEDNLEEITNRINDLFLAIDGIRHIIEKLTKDQLNDR